MAVLQAAATLSSSSWVSSLPSQLSAPSLNASYGSSVNVPLRIKGCSRETLTNEKGCFRRSILAGGGSIAASSFSVGFAFAEEVRVPDNYQTFVDFSDGYSYYYPSDWRDFDFRGHDSAFKDRYLPLQNVRVSFKPTDKKDVRDLGPMEEVVSNLVENVYSAPSQRTRIFDIQERTDNGKNYWTFEYELATPNFARSAFATIAIGNGKYYTLIVGANERRWSRVRRQLKVVADSFKMLDV